ncbi:MAG: hypothetical protein ACOCUR_02620 [Nanoarchaeota archaeon]
MIIPIHRVVTTQYPIAASTTIEPGMVVTLNTTTGYAEPCDAAERPIGLAADKNRASQAYEWVNRVSDSGNETAASGLLSVYVGGEFYVDIDDTAVIYQPDADTEITGVVASGATVTPMTPLYTAANGQLSSSSSDYIVALVTGNPSEYDGAVSGALETGIPGEYEPGSSVTYANDANPRQWVKILIQIHDVA